MYCGFKLLMLLSTPFPLRPSAAIRLARHSRLPLEALSSAAASQVRLLSIAASPKLGFSIRAAEQVNAQEIAKEWPSETVASSPFFKESYSWPEWSKLADHLLSKGYSQRPVLLLDEDDSFATDGVFSEEFSRAAEACIKFAREQPDLLRFLSKKYIESVVENGSPYLFKNGGKSVSRMKLFLGGNRSNGLELEKAQTIDIMRYLLSYMHKYFSTSDCKQFKADESVETSVRKLLLELFDLSGTVWRSKLSGPIAAEPPLQNEHMSRPYGKSFEMKRGDWICQKCTYLNFARNMSCLECGETRPKRQLTGAEWDCPQCDFFNYGRNSSCLRCDCKRPSDPFPSSDPSVGLNLSRSQPHSQDSSDRSSESLPSDNASDSISRSLDRILGRSSTSSSSAQFGNNTMKPRRNPAVPPFVPLPPDMFRKAPDSNNGVQHSSDEGTSSSPSANDLVDLLFKNSESSMKSNGSKESSDSSSGLSKAAAEPEPEYSDKLSDDDFPDIMPIRKGENRFVVSKKKDRSLTSTYKRRLATEQANSYNSVPFVPFPPDYFAKKSNQLAADSTGSSSSLAEKQGEQKIFGDLDQGFEKNRSDSNSSDQIPVGNSSPPTNFPGISDIGSTRLTQSGDNSGKYAGYYSQSPNISPSNCDSSSSSSSDENPAKSTQSYGALIRNSSQSLDRGAMTTGNLSQPSDGSWGPGRGNRGKDESLGSQQNREIRSGGGFSGKSLEGSCVKETDPLDMSEEAKAERWFRRAAQIKDISELSQIPDEDFPEIMPMRKGVNRFVVSRRKTPLERRLTSPQYRKNLPVVSFEPEKDSSN